MISMLLAALLSSANAQNSAGCVRLIDQGGSHDICVGTLVGSGFESGYRFNAGEVTDISSGEGAVRISYKVLTKSSDRMPTDSVYAYLDQNGDISNSRDLAVVVDSVQGLKAGTLVVTYSGVGEISHVFSNGKARLARGSGQSEYAVAIEAADALKFSVKSNSSVLKNGETVVVADQSMGYGTVVGAVEGGYKVELSRMSNGSSMNCSGNSGGGLFSNNDSLFNYSDRLKDTFKYKSDRGMFCTKAFYRDTVTVNVASSRVSRRVMCAAEGLCRGQWITFDASALGRPSRWTKGWIQFAGDNGLVIVRFIEDDGSINEQATTIQSLKAGGVQAVK